MNAIIVSSECKPVDGLTELQNQLRMIHQAALNRAWESLRSELVSVGIENPLNIIPALEKAEMFVRHDPFDKSRTLIVIWKDKQDAKIGEIQVRPNGSFYAEFDVIREHPKDSRWFIEAVTAWGDEHSSKSELRLLAAV